MVKQRGNHDCGVACVAMVAGVSYETALSVLLVHAPLLQEKGTSTEAMVAGLVRLGVPARPRLRRIHERGVVSAFPTVLKTVPNYLLRDEDDRIPSHWVVMDGIQGGAPTPLIYDPAPRRCQNGAPYLIGEALSYILIEGNGRL